jgi:hypothetical protein
LSLRTKNLTLVLLLLTAAVVPAANVGVDFSVSCPAIGTAALPQIGVDKKGISTVIWAAGTTVLGRRFNAAGFALAAPCTIQDVGMNIHCLYLAVADSGQFVVGWVAGYMNSPQELCIKRYNNNGTPFDNAALTIHGNVWPGRATCAVNNLGDCACVLDDAATNAHLYGRILLPNNTQVALPTGSIADSWPVIALGDNRQVVYVIGNSIDGIWHRSGTYASTITWNNAGVYAAGNTFYPSDQTIAADMTRSGSYWIVWRTNSVDTTTIVGRRFNADGTPNGGIMTISNTLPWASNDQAVFCDIGATGYVAVKWSSAIDLNDVPYMRLYNPAGTARTGVVPLFSRAVAAQAQFRAAHLAVDAGGAVRAVCNVRDLVLLQRYTSLGAADGPELPVSSGLSAANPAVAVGHAGGVAAMVWETTADGKIGLKRFVDCRDYTAATINPVNSSGRGSNPALALSGDSLAVVWEDRRDAETEASIWLQLVRSGTIPGGDNKRLSDQGAVCAAPAIAAGASRYFVVWQDVRVEDHGDTSHIYGQLLTKAGVGAGGNFQISAATRGGTAPVVVSNGTTAFAVVWAKQTGGVPLFFSNVFTRRYSATGAAVGDTIRIPGGWSPAAAMDTAGNLGVAWTTNAGQIYCRVIAPDGSDKISAQRVDTGTALKSNVSIGMNSRGACVVAWRVVQNGRPRIESIILNADGSWQGTIRQHADELVRYKTPTPAIAAGDTTALLAWVNSFCVDTTQTDVWGEFSALVDRSPVSISDRERSQAGKNGVPAKNSVTEATEVFNLQGRCVAAWHPGAAIPALPGGFYIMRTRAGELRKVLWVNGTAAAGQP